MVIGKEGTFELIRSIENGIEKYFSNSLMHLERDKEDDSIILISPSTCNGIGNFIKRIGKDRWRAGGTFDDSKLPIAGSYICKKLKNLKTIKFDDSLDALRIETADTVLFFNRTLPTVELEV